MSNGPLPILFSLCLFAGSIFLGPGVAHAQEFSCDVDANVDQVDSAVQEMLLNFAPSIEEYLNDRQWTEDRFLPHERIECQVTILFQEALTQTRFNARLAVTLRRPIYGTMQMTPTIRLAEDQWQFTYTQGQPIAHTAQGYDEITTILDFYAYVLLGFDYDTFSPLGGTPWFERARSIAERARSLGRQNWDTSIDGRGRMDLVSTLLASRYEPIREVYFRYHYGGLDHFSEDPEVARETIYSGLEQVATVQSNFGRGYLSDLFFSTKSEELAAIFRNSDLADEAYDLLTNIDPSNSNTYTSIVE